jgi:hypothetical protein
VSFNLLWTAVWLNKQGPFRFQIVSGSNAFHVDEALARRIGLPVAPRDGQAVGRFGDPRDVTFFTANELVIGGELGLTNIPLAGTLEPESLFLGAVPVPSDQITSFEFGRELMRYSAALPAQMDGYAKIPLRHSALQMGWMPEVECRLGGKTVRLTVATNLPYAVTLYPDAVKRLGLWDGAGPSYERSTRRDGREVEIRIARRGDLELNGLRFERPVLGLYDPRNVLMDRNSGNDGTIGMDVLRRVDVMFDPRRDTMWLRPTSAMASAWSHDRAGFQLDTVKGVTKVTRVDAGSPAEKAGLRVGDVLPGRVAEASMRLAWSQNGPAGQALTLDVERDGVKRPISMVLEDRV